MKNSKVTEEQAACRSRADRHWLMCAHQRGHLLQLDGAIRQLGVSEMRSLEDENTRLEHLVADLTLDKQMPAKGVEKEMYGPPRCK